MSIAERPDWAVAERRTPVKPSPDQSSDIPAEELIWVQPGEKFFVKSYQQASGGHWKVFLEDSRFGITEKYIYDSDASHWLLSWEDDPGEREVLAAPNVVSTESKDTPVGRGLTPDMPFSTRITPNITYGEFALYQEERRFDHKHQCEAAYQLAMGLEQVRKAFGNKPIKVTSGNRPPKINKAVGGASASEHLFVRPNKGAVDFYVVGASIVDVQNYCLNHWKGSVGKGAARGFVHFGMRGKLPRPISWVY